MESSSWECRASHSRASPSRLDLLVRADRGASESAVPGAPQQHQQLLAGQLDVGHAVYVQGNAALGVRAANLDVDGDVGEVDAVHDLEQRHAQGATAAHHAIPDLAIADPAGTAGKDEGLVGRAHVEQLAEDERQGGEDDEGGQGEDDDDRRSSAGLLLSEERPHVEAHRARRLRHDPGHRGRKSVSETQARFVSQFA